MEWSTACPDWERRIVERRSLIPFPPLFTGAETSSSLAVFGGLRIVDAPGMPTIREASRPWVMQFAEAIFGAYDEETGRRLITEFFLLISKKNIKSTMAAGIMMTALIRNWRESAEFLILAPTIEIANNSFFPARDMVRRDEELADLMHVQDHYRTITHRNTGASLKVIAADSEAVSGKKATGVLVEELWLFGKRPNAEDMLREATGGLASRPEGFVIYLSTQSNEPPAGVFLQKLQYARGVRDGLIEDRQFLPVLYEFPKWMLDEGAHRKPENLYVTNPNLGVSVSVDFLERELRKAQETGEQSVVGFMAKHANVEVGLNLRSDRWPGADFWQGAALEGGLTLKQLIERCEVAAVGADGGGLDDLLGLCVIGRERETGRWLAWAKAWAHKIVLERRKDIAPRLLDLETTGDLVIVDMPGQDVEELADLVLEVHEAGLLDRDEEDQEASIGVDVYGIGAVVEAIEARKIPKERIVGISQGWKMTAAVKTTERLVAGGRLWHGGQPLMAWCVGNAKVEQRGNAVVITKQASGTAKIDPLMALFDAAHLMALNPKAGGKSFWEEPDAPAAA
jgi:phage terminase large subunit-like protein